MRGVILALCGALMVSACAEPAKQENMVVASAASAAGTPLAETLCVSSVTGGEETNPLWTSEVDNAAFKGALEASLKNAGLAAPANACRYDVATNLLGLAQPIAGFDMEVTANANYSVFPSGTQNPYFQSTVATPFTATVSDAFVGVTRLRMANEGAVRANISEFIRRLLEHAKTNPPS